MISFNYHIEETPVIKELNELLQVKVISIFLNLTVLNWDFFQKNCITCLILLSLPDQPLLIMLVINPGSKILHEFEQKDADSTSMKQMHFCFTKFTSVNRLKLVYEQSHLLFLDYLYKLKDGLT